MACVGRGRGLLRYLQRVGAGPGCPLSGGSSPSSILPLGPSADTVWKATRGVEWRWLDRLRRDGRSPRLTGDLTL